MYYKIIPVLFVFGIIYSCANNKEEIASMAPSERVANRIGKNVDLIYSEKSAPKIKVQAPIMEEYDGEEPYIEMKKGIKVVFFDSLRQETAVLTSNYAIQYVNEGKMEVKDDVVFVNDKGEQLNTEHLTWLKDSAIIYTEEFVKISTNDEIIMGKGMEAAQNFSWWKIHSITGEVLLKEEELKENN